MSETTRAGMPATPPGLANQLIDAYTGTDYNPLEPRDLLFDEVLQRRETGYDVDDIVRRANMTDPSDQEAVLALVDEMASAERSSDWAYEEPSSLVDITASLTTIPPAAQVDATTLHDRLLAAWLGRIAGCNVGKPIEYGWHWTSAHIRDYLKLADAYPLADYFPVLDPMPEGFVFRENWPDTTKDHVKGSARDDDIGVFPLLWTRDYAASSWIDL